MEAVSPAVTLCRIFTFIYITLSVFAHTAQVLRWSSHRDKRWQRSSGVSFWMTELRFPHYHFDWSECEWVSVWGDRHPHVTVLLTRAEKTAATYSSLYKTHDFQESYTRYISPKCSTDAASRFEETRASSTWLYPLMQPSAFFSTMLCQINRITLLFTPFSGTPAL